MESAIAEFRGAVHDWSAAQPASRPHIAWRPPIRRMARRWILAAASLLMLVSVPAYWHSRQQARAAEIARAVAIVAVSGAALLAPPPAGSCRRDSPRRRAARAGGCGNLPRGSSNHGAAGQSRNLGLRSHKRK